MGKSCLGLMTVAVVLLAAATSRSDVAGPSAQPIEVTQLPSGAAEPTLDPPVKNDPGDESSPKDPFTLYSAEGGVSYDKLSAAEKEAVDRNRDVTGVKQQLDAFATAVAEQSARARAGVAEHLLGLDNVESLGVVP